MKHFWILLLLLLPVNGFTKQPIGLKKWQHDDTTFSKQIGGTVRNYQKPDQTWDSIVNTFEIEGDSVVYVDKSVLRARVNKNGVSKVMLTWEDQEYIVTQKMLGIGWIKISTRQSQWIDSTMNWSNFSVDSNICKWTGVSPGVDYRVLKDNGRVAHGISYKPAFLDSAVTLYNQRPDSLDIALANVMIYTLSANIDNHDSAMGDLFWRNLKDFGYYRFKLTNQRLRFPGSDTLPQIPVKQYWKRRGTKIICIEYVMMRWVKQVHEAYPSATIWHNDTKIIEGTTDVEDAYVRSSLPDNNYGAAVNLITQNAGITAWIRVKNVATNLGAGATIIACTLSAYSYDQTASPNVAAIRALKPWVEGDENGVDNDDGDVTWNDWASDAYEWGTAGGLCSGDDGVDNSQDGTCDATGRDCKGTPEGYVSITVDGMWCNWTISLSLAQGWCDGTINEEGVRLYPLTATTVAYFNSTESGGNQPYWTFIYSLVIPVIETYTSNNSGAAETDSVMLGKPTGVEVGDLLLIIAGNDYNGVASAFEEIADWTRFVNIGDGDTDCKLACYWRIADGGEGDSIKVKGGGTVDEMWGWYIRVSSVNETTPINDVGTALLNASSSTHDITQATSDVDDCIIIYALSFDGGDGYPFSESNTGWTEEDEQQAGTGGNDASGCWGVKSLISLGGAGTVTITSTAGDGAVGIQFAIAPAEAAPPAAGQVIMIQQ